MNDISKLDYFAAHASEEDIKPYLPGNIGQTRDLLIKLGVIPASRANEDVMRAYTSKDVLMLRSWARYQHAAAMMGISNANARMEV